MKKTPAGLRGPSSVQSTNTGWFPAEIPYADRFTDREKAITASERLARDAKTKQHERSWHDGVLLSELIAVLLVEDKNLVKQVSDTDLTLTDLC